MATIDSPVIFPIQIYQSSCLVFFRCTPNLQTHPCPVYQQHHRIQVDLQRFQRHRIQRCFLRGTTLGTQRSPLRWGGGFKSMGYLLDRSGEVDSWENHLETCMRTPNHSRELEDRHRTRYILKLVGKHT